MLWPLGLPRRGVRERFDLPLAFVNLEEGEKEALQACVRGVAHVAFVDLSVEVVAVGPVDGAEVCSTGMRTGVDAAMDALLR